MKINKLETHDRLLEFKKNDFDIGARCQKIIDSRPFGDHQFYIFAHARTHDDGVTKRMIWQPRLTKPEAQENSMLFRVKPGSDNVRVMWIIPAKEMWKEYEKGKMIEDETICWSINMFKNKRKDLEAKEPDDLSDARIDEIYREISAEALRKKGKRFFSSTLKI